MGAGAKHLCSTSRLLQAYQRSIFSRVFGWSGKTTQQITVESRREPPASFEREILIGWEVGKMTSKNIKENQKSKQDASDIQNHVIAAPLFRDGLWEICRISYHLLTALLWKESHYLSWFWKSTTKKTHGKLPENIGGKKQRGGEFFFYLSIARKKKLKKEATWQTQLNPKHGFNVSRPPTNYSPVPFYFLRRRAFGFTFCVFLVFPYLDVFQLMTAVKGKEKSAIFGDVWRLILIGHTAQWQRHA